MEPYEFQEDNLFVRMKVVGIGRSGCNTVNRMIEEGFLGVEFVAIDTDVQSLMQSKAPTRLRIGGKLTRGLGTGGNVETGRKASGEAASLLYNVFIGSDIVFITAGMGGGTGTGVAPMLAQIAKKVGALTIAIVTSPFAFEGLNRARTAQDGIDKLKQHIDTLVVLSNDRLLQIVDKNVGLENAYRLADDVLRKSVQSLAELVKLDFAYVRSIMMGGGTAFLSVGRASGPERARQAVDSALKNLLLDITIEGARNVLFSIAGGTDLALSEVNEAATIIREAAHPQANLIFRSVTEPELQKEISVSLLATGFISEKRGESSITPVKVEKPPEKVELTVPDRAEEVAKAIDLLNPEETNLPEFLKGRNRPVVMLPTKEQEMREEKLSAPETEPVQEQVPESLSPVKGEEPKTQPLARRKTRRGKL